MIGPQPEITEPPPSVEQAHDQVRHPLGTDKLGNQDPPRWRQQLPDVAQRLPQVGRRVQHLRRDDHVELVRLETLRARVLFDIQAVVPQERIIPELLLNMGEEMGRQVGEDIFDPVRRQPRRQVRRHAAGAAADLEHTQCPSPGHSLDQHTQGVLNQKVVEPPGKPVLVELLGVGQ
jgi:hypothetical protein